MIPQINRLKELSDLLNNYLIRIEEFKQLDSPKIVKSSRPMRLGKLAGKVNVGLTNISIFLGVYGIEIDSNPNLKISAEHHALVAWVFNADKELRDQSSGNILTEKRETISIDSLKKDYPQMFTDEKTNQEPEKVEIETIKAKAKKIKGPTIVGKIDLTNINKDDTKSNKSKGRRKRTK